MDVLIGVDIGTHSTKAVALEAGGRRLGEASCSHGIEILQAGYCEQDAERVWWQGFVTVVRRLLKQGTFRPEEVRSIGVLSRFTGPGELNAADQIISDIRELTEAVPEILRRKFS